MERKEFLRNMGLSAASVLVAPSILADSGPEYLKRPIIVKNKLALNITPVKLEIAKGFIIDTIGYNGTCPGPVLRMREGEKIAVDVYNRTGHDEIVHWHGQHLPAEVDGAVEEGTPVVRANGHRRYIFTPGPSGTRWYHTHMPSGGNLHRSTYSGQRGIVFIEPKNDPGDYDREVFLITHEWHPFLSESFGTEFDRPVFTINGKVLGHGSPVKVREGERVMFRIVNGNAKEEIQVAFPGHLMHVIGLDGNPVPNPNNVAELLMGSGERADVIVEMNNPGVWVFGEQRENRRKGGLGIVVEYANQKGKPKWEPVKGQQWDYTFFGSNAPVPQPDEEIKMVFDRIRENGESIWRINGKPFEEQENYKIRYGRRYRLVFEDKSNRLHPLHLHRHSFELTNIEGKATSGIIKDTVCIQPNGHVEVDFTADQKGLSLFHCHMQNHMEDGFMSLFECI